MRDILEALAPHAILVGSATTCSNPNDIDLVVSAKGLAIARRVLPGPLESEMSGNLSTFQTELPIECFRYWYGPGYRSLARRKRELIRVNLYGVEFRAWPLSTREE